MTTYRYDAGYSSRCFDSYSYDGASISQYACSVLMVAVYLGTLIWLCVVRKRTGPGRHLIGLPYIFALAFRFIQQVISFISSTLSACRVTSNTAELYNWSIASMVFYALQTFLLLWVVIFTLNIMLRKQLGASTSALELVFGVVLFVLGALLLTYTVLTCYIYYYGVRSFNRYYYWNNGFNYMSAAYVGLAFVCVYLVSISGSGILAILGARSLKKKHGAPSSLVVGITLLTVFLFIYVLLDVVTSAMALSNYSFYINRVGLAIINWFQAFALAATYITIIVIAKNAAWRSTTFAETQPMEQQYAYYQQEPPVYTGPGQHA